MCNKEQHTEDLQLYKDQLEERCSQLEHEKNRIKHETTVVWFHNVIIYALHGWKFSQHRIFAV